MKNSFQIFKSLLIVLIFAISFKDLLSQEEFDPSKITDDTQLVGLYEDEITSLNHLIKNDSTFKTKVVNLNKSKEISFENIRKTPNNPIFAEGEYKRIDDYNKQIREVEAEIIENQNLIKKKSLYIDKIKKELNARNQLSLENKAKFESEKQRQQKIKEDLYHQNCRMFATTVYGWKQLASTNKTLSSLAETLLIFPEKGASMFETVGKILGAATGAFGVVTSLINSNSEGLKIGTAGLSLTALLELLPSDSKVLIENVSRNIALTDEVQTLVKLSEPFNKEVNNLYDNMIKRVPDVFKGGQELVVNWTPNKEEINNFEIVLEKQKDLSGGYEKLIAKIEYIIGITNSDINKEKLNSLKGEADKTKVNLGEAHMNLKNMLEIVKLGI